MDYNHVALFVHVAKAGSFTAAAEQVGLPKSSLSRAVTQLEKGLGVRLLQRTTRKLALTEAGRAYYDTVSGSMASIDEADAQARERGTDPRGTVRITAPPDFAALASALAAFSRKHPGIRVELTIASRFVDLVTEGFDLAVRAGRLEDSSLIVRRLGDIEMALVASPAYLRRRGRPKTVAELPAHDWVLYRAVAGRAALALSRGDEAEAVEVTGSLVADEMSFCRVAVEEGAGIALLPVHTIIDSVTSGKLEQVLPGWTHAGAALFLVLPSSRQLPARVALVRDFLAAQLTKQLAASQERCQGHKRGGARKAR